MEDARKGAIKQGIQIFLKEQMRAEDFEKIEKTIAIMENNANLDSLRDYLFDFVQKMTPQIGPAGVEGMFDEHIDQMRQLKVPIETYVHDIRVQKNFAVKFWHLLLNEDRLGDFTVLFNYAYLVEIERLEKSFRSGDRTPWLKELHQSMMKLIDADSIRTEQILTNLWAYKVTYPPPDSSEMPLFVKLISSVNDEIVGLLLKFPYMKLTRGEGNLFPFLN